MDDGEAVLVKTCSSPTILSVSRLSLRKTVPSDAQMNAFS